MVAGSISPRLMSMDPTTENTKCKNMLENCSQPLTLYGEHIV